MLLNSNFVLSKVGNGKITKDKNRQDLMTDFENNCL